MHQESSKSGTADKTAGILVVQADASVAVSPSSQFLAFFWFRILLTLIVLILL